MKSCIACGETFESIARSCPNCGDAPKLVNGFNAYAPELAKDGSGFKVEYFNELQKLESGNFWFRSRNKLIEWMLSNFSSEFHSLLEVGCGTGYVLSGISAAFPNRTFVGSEIFVEGLEFAARRLPDVTLIQMDARQIPFKEEFDVICACDVIEHIKEDQRVLNEFNKALKVGGIILLTVPQHMWLWSEVDEIACHERRYGSVELKEKVEKAGFEILKNTSFVSLLLPLMFLSRFRRKRRGRDFDHSSELKLSPILNQILEKIMLAELMLIKAGLNLPIGGSRLVVAVKR